MILDLKQRDNCNSCGMLITTVKDTGEGIKNEIKDKLFKMFGIISTKGNIISTQGIGLGLSICKSLTE